MGKFSTRLTPIESYVAIDIETTGLSTDFCEIIELAGAKVVDGVVTGRFQELVRPDDLPIPDFIEELTGITSEMLEDARRLDEVLPEYLAFVGDSPVVGQRVSFDVRFVDYFSNKILSKDFQPIACDTMRFARLLFPEMPHHRLKDIVAKCEEVSGSASEFGRAHRAMADVDMTLWCYEILRPLLVAKFGNDPEKELARRKRASQLGGHTSSREYIDGLTPTVEEIDEGNPFFGSTVCFTGKLSSMTRKAAWQEVVNLGAVPSPTISKKVDYLVVGSFDFSANMKGDKSKKLVSAEKLYSKFGSPEIVSEDFFQQFLG